jgi:hypothetical protein
VPGGTEIHGNAVAMLMNPQVFGGDADLFRPERFLECGEEQRRHMVKVVDLSFGHGRWLCLGKPLVMIELNKIFVEVRCLAMRFDNIAITDATSFAYSSCCGSSISNWSMQSSPGNARLIQLQSSPTSIFDSGKTRWIEGNGRMSCIGIVKNQEGKGSMGLPPPVRTRVIVFWETT